ncbi:uncharacterized protein K452DRAFT_133930 [Aplosporella prunicola CBS 121167]|uniref:Uncharacterized protein n=1 Tax=Aplosporella prunicola CBS 121167 TaxID=1176127 RepID=A0A6A6BLP4_9PEZI|nr:uncharacterized protein K452DRAFT_133930 [Aplosporella prunicola CBS 121167]KAF2145039.1 hypothetical protein K452DRAFT_133930 [Aplosporella prunicola CBS 121167]
MDADNDDEPHAKPGHRRSLSGRLLATLPFLRHSDPDPDPDLSPAPSPADETDALLPRRHKNTTTSGGGGRRRRGSLRKTALLGPGRQRTSDLLQASALAPRPASSLTTSEHDDRPPRGRDRSYSHSSTAAAAASSSSDSGWPTPRPTAQQQQQQTYASTTDDDEQQQQQGRSNGSGGSTLGPAHFAALQRRRSAKSAVTIGAAAGGALSGATTRHSSPLALPPATLDLDEWDYGETEWWGWVVLVVTWVVFVVGMGSCLDVWSWAWDVGETPYAPPELEDDPTLPIVGYYPALMVLTAVMAWVWVVVAWVGMKYFRHAKFMGDES